MTEISEKKTRKKRQKNCQIGSSVQCKCMLLTSGVLLLTMYVINMWFQSGQKLISSTLNWYTL